jgi:hypothetical protein
MLETRLMLESRVGTSESSEQRTAVQCDPNNARVCVCVCVCGGGGTRCSHISMSRTCIRSRSATYSQQIPTKPMPVLMNPAAMAHNLNGISDAESPYFGQGREHSDTSPAASIQYLACARARVCVCVCVCVARLAKVDTACIKLAKACCTLSMLAKRGMEITRACARTSAGRTRLE